MAPGVHSSESESPSSAVSRLADKFHAYVPPTKTERDAATRRLSDASAPPLIDCSSMDVSWAWFQRLPEDAVSDIHHELMHNGLSHLAWGSKPAFYLEGEFESGIWGAMERCAALSGVRPNFMLVPSARNAHTPEAEHEGYLINIRNALIAIDADREFFLRRFNLNATHTNDYILRCCVIPTLADKGPSEELELTAIILGFGLEGGRAMQVYSTGDEGTRENINKQSARVDAWANALKKLFKSETNFDYPMPAPPNFIKEDNYPTRARVYRYLQEGHGIQMSHSELLSRYDAWTDGSLLADARLFAAAFVGTVIADPIVR